LTLLEILAVVTIVGILAVLAAVGYRRFIASSKLVEPKNMIQSIRAAQESFKAENGHYLDVSPSLGVGVSYPLLTPGMSKTGWGADCTNCKNGPQGWRALNVVPDGPVQFGYTTVASDASCDPACRGANVVIGGKAINFTAQGPVKGPWYIVEAVGDTDGNGIFCTVVGSSFDNELWVDQEGE
jgi:type IV pilus assembly protein PilA